MRTLYATLPFSLLLFSGTVLAQCGAGEVQVTIGINTDTYGYETYWQLVPFGNDCGTGTIFEGGNLTMGCGGGGGQAQEQSGYLPDTTYLEGPWCLTEGAPYNIHMIDDWGDGQASAEVFIGGVSIGVYAGDGPRTVQTFGMARDMAVSQSYSPLFSTVNETTRVRGLVRNFGFEPVTSFDLSYAVDGAPPVTTTFNGLDMHAGDNYEFVHDIAWLPSDEGTSTLDVRVSAINGSDDLNQSNDAMVTQVLISAGIPDLADAYLAAEPLVTTIANSDNDILVPRDLAFHPDGGRNQLWVLNKDTEASGASTVTFYGAGDPGMTHEWRKDGNSWHFMSLPTGIAMGDNGNFATSPGVFDANHNGGTPFTGPSLWSGDTAIYARPTMGNGSHLDMLHMNPNSQGIAHDYWNRFWVVDGYTGDIVMNDFRADHGPGNDYHGNAIIRRYADFTITRDTADHIVSHNVLDKSTGWLYVVDHGGQRVLRMNVNTGTVSGPATEWNYETVLEYTMVTGYDWEVIITEGLEQPAGIEMVGTHLYVSDHANGDIIIYDVSGSAFPELGRIHTNTPGLMGVTVGPDGRIWGVNATTHELLRVDPQGPTGGQERGTGALRCWPNPSDERLYLEIPDGMRAQQDFILRDAVGRIVQRGSLNTRIASLPTAALPSGTYSLELWDADARSSVLVCITH